MQRGPCGLCKSVWDEPEGLPPECQGICPNCCPRRSKGVVIQIGRINPVAQIRHEKIEGKSVHK